MMRATLNLTDGVWAITEPDASREIIVEMGFTGATVPVVFHGLSYGWSATAASVQQSAAYPPENVVYMSSDQQYISADILNVLPGEAVTMSFWAENDGESFEHETTFVVPEVIAVEEPS